MREVIIKGVGLGGQNFWVQLIDLCKAFIPNCGVLLCSETLEKFSVVSLLFCLLESDFSAHI